jgi:hypothetical protein
MPFILSRTTPVAPLCAIATAATAEAASAIAPVHCFSICLTALGLLFLIDHRAPHFRRFANSAHVLGQD